MNSLSTKKAVHVKWAGKTIALGTFPTSEAEEKCARAKALTRAWRSTMRPKPSREWVMEELERLNVRVVSGRPPKEAGGSDSEVNDSEERMHKNGVGSSVADPNMIPRRGSITASLLNAAELARGLGIDTNSMINQRRNSSLAMSLLDDNREVNIPATGSDPVIPHHRPLVGGGSAAAYEAARADHYRKLAEQKATSRGEDSGVGSGSINVSQSTGAPSTARRLSSLGNLLGDSSNGLSGGSSLGLPVNPNAHYEMLKLHHMNLLNEIQETTLMMNLYQQQQIQQHQQLQQQRKLQEQQQKLLTQQQMLNGSSNSVGRSNSLGLGVSFNQPSNVRRDSIGNSSVSKKDTVDPQKGVPKGANPPGKDLSAAQTELNAAQSELNAHEDQLKKIKAEIEERKRMLEQLEHSSPSKQAEKQGIENGSSLEEENGVGDNSLEPIAKRIKVSNEADV